MKQVAAALAIATLLAMAANPALACSRSNAKAAGYQAAHLSKAPAAAKVAAKTNAADVAGTASAASVSSATESEQTAAAIPSGERQSAATL